MSDPTKMVLAEYEVACATEGCPSVERVITVMAPIDSPQIVCGPCGAVIIPGDPVG